MVNKIKIFFFDVDSTTFDHSMWGVRESTMKALRELKSKGYILYLDTTRSFDELRNVPKEFIDIMGGIICLGGAYIYEKGNIEYSAIDKKHVDEGIAYLEEHHYPYRYATNDGKGFLNMDHPKWSKVFDKLYHMIPEVKKYEGEEVLHILIGNDNDELVSNLKRIFKDEEIDYIPPCLEVDPSGVNKGTMALKVAKKYGFDKENICAFGDSNNDIELLKSVGLAIAMGNGSDEVKAVSDYITDDIKDDGLYKALKKYGFVE